MNKRAELYGDRIGKVDLVECMGSDLTIVNSACVSFGKYKEALDPVVIGAYRRAKNETS
jgi:hypothetical protein|tara:strand:- start:811 stop:987 length:177 start_codon:yes stop_codon:yes gene_type:complete